MPPKTYGPANWKWCFTLNNPSVDAVDRVDAAWRGLTGVKFLFREEVGESGTPHLQGVLWTTNRTAKGRLAAFRPLSKPFLVPGITDKAHWEQLRVSPQSHVDYCAGTGGHDGKPGGIPIHNLEKSDWPESWVAREKQRAKKILDRKLKLAAERAARREAAEARRQAMWMDPVHRARMIAEKDEKLNKCDFRLYGWHEKWEEQGMPPLFRPYCSGYDYHPDFKFRGGEIRLGGRSAFVGKGQGRCRDDRCLCDGRNVFAVEMSDAGAVKLGEIVRVDEE